MKLYCLPAGRYWIGDPCYAIDGADWMQVLEDGEYFNTPTIIDFKGFLIGAASTSYGDGTYYDQDGREYGVDSGLLGAVHTGLAKHSIGGHIVDFPEPFNIGYVAEGGVVVIGHIQIETAPEDDEEFDEPEDPDEFDDGEW